MSDNKFYTKEIITTHEDADGNVSSTSTRTTTNIQRNGEPDYIKIYTKMWCEFNQIPEKWHRLFLELATRMTYTNSSDLETSQTVVVYGATTEAIREACGWKDKSTLRKGLKALCECGAIRKTAFRATYQINPNYASRGEWKYNPRLQRGGVEDLVAKFSFRDGKVSTQILWADNGDDDPFNEMYREGMGVSKRDATVLKVSTYNKEDQLPGQLTFDNLELATVNG